MCYALWRLRARHGGNAENRGDPGCGYRRAQLVNAESGAHLWADRFEEDVADLFKLQDEARRLNPAITIKWMKEHSPNLPAVFDGLRKAGLPDE